MVSLGIVLEKPYLYLRLITIKPQDMNYKEYFNDNPTTLKERKEAIKQLFEWVCEDHDLNNFTLTYSTRMRTSLGQCEYNTLLKTGRIRLNQKYVELAPWMKVVDTVLHECAHAADTNERGTSSHGHSWKRWCVLLGADPTRTKHTADLEKYAETIKKEAKYTATCPCCGHKTSFHRKPKRRYYHTECNTLTLRIRRAAADDRDRGYVFLKVKQNY